MSEQRKNKTIQIKINGRTCAIPEGSNINQLKDILGVSLEGTAIELKGGIVTPSQYQNTLLDDGDSLELVRLVGGG